MAPITDSAAPRATALRDLHFPQGTRTEGVGGDFEGRSCGLAADVDESAHAVGALLRGSGHDSIRHNAAQQVGLAHNHHAAQSLAFSPLVDGAGSMAGMAVGSAFVGGTAVFAMHAGLSEWLGAGAEAREYRTYAKTARAEKAAFTALPADAQQRLAAIGVTLANAAAERARANDACAKATDEGGLIGKYSFLSGAGLMGRAVLEVGRNAGLAVAGHSTHIAAFAASGAVAPAIVQTTGLLSNGFAMAASGLAVALGVHFCNKTGSAHKALRSELPELQKHWEAVGKAFPAYKKFLVDKSAAREKFLGGFTMKNRAFTAGAGIYAAGTILPVVVKMLVASGVISSKKVGTNIVLGLFSVGILGALTMGVFSHQFFYGHPTLGRYEKYGVGESEAFNRRLLSVVDTFHFASDKGNLPLSHSMETGMRLRDSAYTMIGAREAARTGFIATAAGAIGKKFAAYSHTGAADYAAHRPYPTKIRAFLQGGQLSAKDLAHWISDEPNARVCADSCTKILDAQLEHAHTENAVLARMAQQIHGRDSFPAKTDYSDTDKAFADFETKLNDGWAASNEKIKNMENVRAALHEAPDHPALQEAFTSFLATQLGHEYKPFKDEPVEKPLAQYLHATLADSHNNDRGTLLETEREAARLRKTSPHAFVPIIR